MTLRKSLAFLATAAAFMIATAVASEQNTTLQKMEKKLKIDQKQISVSGISSGGFMAHQFHVAHSANLKGAGIIAGGFYHCAQGNLRIALTECTTFGEQFKWWLINWPYQSYSGPCPAPPAQQARCKDIADTMAENAVKHTMKLDESKIDNPKNLIGDRVILILGKSDRLVPEGIMDATDLYYKKIYEHYEQKPQANDLIYLKTLPAEHSVPIDEFIGLKVAEGDKVQFNKGEQVGNCKTFGSPFLNVCNKQECNNSCCTIKPCPSYNEAGNLDCMDCDLQCATQCEITIDTAGAILEHIYCRRNDPDCRWNQRREDIKAKDWDLFGAPTVKDNCLKNENGEIDTRCNWLRERIFLFDQPQKFTDMRDTFLAKQGFIFVPKQCIDGSKDCNKLHIVFHGCEQGVDFIYRADAVYSKEWTAFVENAGYNEWADANDIVLLYPQARTDVSLNPKGCWDFWDYGTNKDYDTKKGRQILAVWQMVEALVPSLKK